MCLNQPPRPDQPQDRPPAQPQKLTPKVALVTSSNPGICTRTALQLANEGAKVMICGRNGTQGMATVKQIRHNGGNATFTLADIAVPADAQAVVEETIATYGRLDILFNDATSGYSHDGSILEVSEAVWDRISEAVLKGTFFCCQYALPFLQQSSSGTIINLIQQPSLQAPHSVTSICQGGIVALTQAIAQQYPQGAPSNTATANLIWATGAPEPASPGQSPAAPAAVINPTSLSTLQTLNGPAEGTEAGRPFTDVAEAIMYLAVYGSRLHGYALRVSAPNTPDISSANPKSPE